VDASLRELERCLDELGMIGLNLHISVLDRSVAEDEFLPIYEEMNRRGALDPRETGEPAGGLHLLLPVRGWHSLAHD
jgi:hypothetical protein